MNLHEKLLDVYIKYNNIVKNEQERLNIAQKQVDVFLNHVLDEIRNGNLEQKDVYGFIENHIRIYEGLVYASGQPIGDNNVRTRYWR